MRLCRLLSGWLGGVSDAPERKETICRREGAPVDVMLDSHLLLNQFIGLRFSNRTEKPLKCLLECNTKGEKRQFLKPNLIPSSVYSSLSSWIKRVPLVFVHLLIDFVAFLNLSNTIEKKPLNNVHLVDVTMFSSIPINNIHNILFSPIDESV